LDDKSPVGRLSLTMDHITREGQMAIYGFLFEDDLFALGMVHKEMV
jgi:hypothetical protein